MKILIISSNLIGDTILSTGVVDHFLKNNPNAQFTFIIGPTAGQIYQHFPNLEKIILIKKEKFNTHWLTMYLHCCNIKWDIRLSNETFALKIIKLVELKSIENKSKIIKISANEKISQFIKENYKCCYRYWFVS